MLTNLIFTGGVDKVDQHLADYPITRKRGKKYYKKIFFHMLEHALWNSFVLYKKKGGLKTHLQFRMDLITKIIEAYCSTEAQTKGRPSSLPNPLRMTERHFPDYIPPTDKKENPTRVCQVCSRTKDRNGKKIRKESRYWCADCEVALCVAPCFRIFHTKTNF